eukprot:CAMPEP_0177316698 /NCGR_PEP_ID=MMETSP0368-20130122/13135_1 /TAXON_ID=447022 ORGANISM="Scrippsiella hangoei-like, Strain SHHI-4" /NCGR_SAMPLE_ID=MMETSP0368 /ASSEMBLY_ACC=CAM_ASM_000363 /LENGTH=80 /DNA_ID=CAMNT_0018775989 /DNA_START=10 /DNA_END=250 /DNA_ORIENTATION=-
MALSSSAASNDGSASSAQRRPGWAREVPMRGTAHKGAAAKWRRRPPAMCGGQPAESSCSASPTAEGSVHRRQSLGELVLP